MTHVLLYLSPADTAYDRMTDVRLTAINPNDIVAIEVLKGAAAKELSGRTDTHGVITITLNQSGTDAWRRAAAAHAAKP